MLILLLLLCATARPLTRYLAMACLRWALLGLATSRACAFAPTTNRQWLSVRLTSDSSHGLSYGEISAAERTGLADKVMADKVLADTHSLSQSTASLRDDGFVVLPPTSTRATNVGADLVATVSAEVRARLETLLSAVDAAGINRIKSRYRACG